MVEERKEREREREEEGEEGVDVGGRKRVRWISIISGWSTQYLQRLPNPAYC